MIDGIVKTQEQSNIDYSFNKVTAVNKSPEIDIKNKDTSIIEKNPNIKGVKPIHNSFEMNSVNEVVLDNLQFGFNHKTKDFIVKVQRGDAEFQYPTEDMMKLKEFIMSQNEVNNKRYVNNLAKERVDIFLN